MRCDGKVYSSFYVFNLHLWYGSCAPTIEYFFNCKSLEQHGVSKLLLTFGEYSELRIQRHGDS